MNTEIIIQFNMTLKEGGEMYLRIVDGKELYTTGDIAKLVDRSTQTINIWYKYSELIRDYKRKHDPVMPKCTKINGIKYWTKDQLIQIKSFASSIRRGSISQYTREKCWGKRGREIQKRYIEKREKEIEAIRKFRELPLHEQKRIRQVERFKKWKKEHKSK